MCNSYKGTYWPQNPEEPFFPNPCDHVMTEHVRFIDFRVEAKSKHGGFMEEALRLNEETLVSWRKSHARMIRAFEREIAELKKLKRKLRKRVTRDEHGQEVGRDIETIEGQIADRLATLDQLCGTTLAPLDPNAGS
jgi:DNA-binding Lrp family transcriptional regulator